MVHPIQVLKIYFLVVFSKFFSILKLLLSTYSLNFTPIGET